MTFEYSDCPIALNMVESNAMQRVEFCCLSFHGCLAYWALSGELEAAQKIANKHGDLVGLYFRSIYINLEMIEAV